MNRRGLAARCRARKPRRSVRLCLVGPGGNVHADMIITRRKAIECKPSPGIGSTRPYPHVREFAAVGECCRQKRDDCLLNGVAVAVKDPAFDVSVSNEPYRGYGTAAIAKTFYLAIADRLHPRGGDIDSILPWRKPVDSHDPGRV